MIEEDDILLWRMIFLAMVSNYINEARKDPRPVGFTLEQPASPKDYKPEVVSFWDTKEWSSLKKEFGWDETTFAQGQYGGSATKPTTFGGNLKLEVNNHKRMKKASEGVETKSSKGLSRWAPGVMAMVAEALTTQVMQRNPMLRPLSWDEHIAHGHTPYRRDCAVCQQTIAAVPSSQKSSISSWRSSFLGRCWTVSPSKRYWRSLRKMDVGWHSDMGSPR